MKPTQEVVIKPALKDDVDILQKLCIATFSDTYAKYNTVEDMRLYTAEHFNRKKLLDELESKMNFFFVAALNHEPVGYMKLRTSVELAQLKNKKSIELERIYVVKHFQSAGVGYQFIQFCS